MSGQHSDKPNIVILHTDQQRYDSLGCCGNPCGATPNLDALAREGTVFHRHLSCNPICQPSRASLLTGRYPNGHGVWTNGLSLFRASETDLDPESTKISRHWYQRDFTGDIPTLADIFAAVGYHTGAVGKLHLTPYLATAGHRRRESYSLWAENPEEAEQWTGPYYGFQHTELAIGHGEHVNGHYRRWLRREYPEVVEAVTTASPSRPFPEIHDLYPSPVPVEAHHSTWVARRAEAFLARAAATEQPFLLFAGFPDPHHPFVPPAEIAELFRDADISSPHINEDAYHTKPEAWQRLRRQGSPASAARLSEACIRQIRQYTLAQVYLIDRAVGHICETLKKLGVWENTIIIFTSDHGDFLGDYRLLRKELVCSEALTHVPFILRAPGAGLPRETAAPMSNVDVLPTLCRLAGVNLPDDIHGTDIVPVINGKRDNLPMVMSYDGSAPKYHNFSIYDGRYRYTEFPGTGECELYDHHQDQHELVNIAAERSAADTVERLSHLLREQHLRTDNPCVGRICLW